MCVDLAVDFTGEFRIRLPSRRFSRTPSLAGEARCVLQAAAFDRQRPPHSNTPLSLQIRRIGEFIRNCQIWCPGAFRNRNQLSRVQVARSFRGLNAESTGINDAACGAQ